LETAIDRIDLFVLSCRLPDTIGNACRFFDRRETLFVRVMTRGGAIGWGETWAMAAPAAALIQAVLGPAALGEDVRYPAKIWRKLSRFIVNDRRGLTHMAISALDIAIWDASARALGVPLSARLGGALRDRLTCYVSGPFLKPGAEPYAHYLADIDGYLEQGFRNVKVRAGVGAREDAALIAAVRSRIGAEIGLMVDFNEAGDVAQALDFSRRVDDADLIWLEEPVLHDDLPSWKRVSAGTGLPLAGGESLYGLAAFRDFLCAGVFAVVQPDLALCGGLTEGLRIAALAEAFNVPIAPHVWGGAVNFNASLHFAAILPDRTRPGGRFPFFEYDASFNPLRSAFLDCPIGDDGLVAVPKGPGTGLEIGADQLAPFLTAKYAVN
jgi:D-galactarolactone cycloisomerase